MTLVILIKLNFVTITSLLVKHGNQWKSSVQVCIWRV